jgi:hypothetical protein
MAQRRVDMHGRKQYPAEAEVRKRYKRAAEGGGAVSSRGAEAGRLQRKYLIRVVNRLRAPAGAEPVDDGAGDLRR